MSDARYYLSIFLRRFHWFLIVAGLISGVAITVAMTLPPAYVSQVRLILESSQIPGELAESTVRMAPQERLQIFETRLLTRANLLDIAKRQNVLDGQEVMPADDIVNAMRARTTIRRSGGRNETMQMTLSFEASRAQTAAAVLNEYLTLILQEDSQMRNRRAAQTHEFFEQEVDRLGDELERQSAAILAFQNQNADALPENLNYHLSQQATVQERLAQIERDIAGLKKQRDRLTQVFEATGRVTGVSPEARSPEEINLDRLEHELAQALLIYSPENPRVKLLQSRVAQFKETMLAGQAGQVADDTGTNDPAAAMLELQLAEIDTQIQTLTEQHTTLEARLATLEDSIARTPANVIALAAMERDYANTQAQYNTATDRLATASTGERIELLSRGEQVTVVEQPVAPNRPTKPNRMLIAGGGVFLGIAAGLGLIVLLEFLNNTARRPNDLVKKLGVTPIATIPYLRTRGETVRHRTTVILATLAIIVMIPAAIYTVHTYYQPLDLIADRVMNKLGVRG
ncbi:GumC family protein [Actibacterium sp. D379-3]